MYCLTWMLLYGVTCAIAAQSSMTSVPSFRRYDYGEPNLPIDYTGLRDVQQYNTLFSYALSRQVLDNPIGVDQCPLAISTLEQSLAKSMLKARLELGDKELEGFGNKHANLVKMADLLNALDITDINVPMPQGISSIQIQHFLEEEAPDIAQKWDELKDISAKNPLENLLENMTVQRILNEIDQQIEMAFASDRAYYKLNLSNDMDAWIRSLSDTRLMVRSTGAEDSNSTANAGGNISAAYVSPDARSLCSAIGRVVRSYFGPSSLQNRINAGLNPFKDELKLAVTVQELIGEPVGGAVSPSDIPASFVLFTHEPLYVDVAKEQFRVMRLSATYGHGEAVVSNQGIGTDSILLMRSESKPDEIYYLYDNQRKTERLAPLLDNDGEVHLGKVKNPASLAHKQIFTTEQLHGIYKAGILMESFFGSHPTDIEGVVRGGQLYFVQARPVNRQPLLPTYIDKSSSNKIQAEALVIGKGSVIKITHKNEIFLAATLEEAEKKFKMDRHKLVIVTHPEPENSHPVVNFSGLGIPCLYAPQDMDHLEQFINLINKNHPLAVCMQTASLHIWEDATTIDDHIVEGFAVHPAKIALSLPSSHVLAIPSSSAAPMLQTLLGTLREAKTTTEALDALALLEAQPQVKQLSEKIQTISPFASSTNGVEHYLQILNDLNTLIVRSIAETRTTLQRQAPEARLPALFNIKILETSILGSHKVSTRQGAYSLADADAIFTAVDTLISYQNELSHPAHCIDILLLGKQGADEAFDHWRSFLLELEPCVERNEVTKEELGQFKTLINSLAESEAMPVWLTFFQSQGGSVIDQINATLSMVTTSNQVFMQDLLEDRASLMQMRNDPSRFADPQMGGAVWNELQAYIEKYTAEDWLNTAKSVSPITKVMMSQLMECAVDCLDLAAKAVKSSSQLSEIDRIKHFKAMLLPYFKLMDTWTHTFIPSETLLSWQNDANYFTTIKTILTGLPSDDGGQLRPSRDFSVASAMVGSRAAFDRHQPKTLEDVLTLLHQNILATINALNQGLLTSQQINSSLLPQSIKKIMQEMDNISTFQKQRIGMYISSKEIVLHYNVPLRNHSGKIEIHYNCDSHEITFKGHFLGQARGRWYEAGDWITFLEKHKIFEANHPLVITEQELTFSWKISPEILKEALSEYSKMAAYSMGGQTLDSYKDNTLALLQAKERESLISHIKSTTSLVQEGQRVEVAIKLAKDNIHNWRRDIYSPALDLCIALVEKEQGFELAIEAAIEGMTSPDNTRRQASLNLFKALIEKEQGFEPAITIAIEGIASSDGSIRETSLNLFKVLFEKEQGFEQAITVAIKRMASPASLDLFKALFEKGQGFEPAITAAAEGMKDSINNDMRIASLDLFEVLVKSEKGFVPAITAAIDGLRSDYYYERVQSLNLFDALFKKEEGFDLAITTALEMLKSLNDDTRRAALDLFEALVRHGQGFEPAITAAVDGMMSQNNDIKQGSRYLFQALFEKGQGFEPAIIAIIVRMDSPNDNKKQASLDLFKLMLEKGQGFESIIIKTLEMMMYLDSDTRIITLDLFKILVEKGQGFESAITVAIEEMKRPDNDTKWAALGLFTALVKKGQGFEPAITAATEEMNRPDNDMKWEALGLFQNLLEKGQGFTPAITAAIDGMTHDDYLTRLVSLNILRTTLVEKGQGFTPALAAAIKGISIERHDQDHQFIPPELLDALIENKLFLPDACQNNQVFLLTMTKHNPKFILFASDSLQNNQEFLLAAIKQNPNVIQFAPKADKMVMRYKARLSEIKPHNLSEEQRKKITDLIHAINDQIEGSSSTQFKRKMQGNVTMLEEFNSLTQTMEPSSAVEKIKEDARFQQAFLATGSRATKLIEEIETEYKKPELK